MTFYKLSCDNRYGSIEIIRFFILIFMIFGIIIILIRERGRFIKILIASTHCTGVSNSLSINNEFTKEFELSP